MEWNALWDGLRHYEQEMAVAQLILAMLGMGATLQVSDFLHIRNRRWAIGIVILGQYLVFPLFTLAVISLLNLPQGAGLGLFLIAVMPSGAMSNLFAHLGRGHLALSITATLASTLCCVVLTPILLTTLAAHVVPSGFRMPAEIILRDGCLYLIIPVSAGMGIRYYLKHLAIVVSHWSIRISVLILVVIAVSSLGSGRIELWQYGWKLPVMLIGFCGCLYASTYFLAQAVGYSTYDAYTMALEMAVRNGNLAILLSATIFSRGVLAGSELSTGCLYVSLFYSGTALGFGMVAIVSRRLRLPAEELIISEPQHDSDHTEAPPSTQKDSSV